MKIVEQECYNLSIGLSPSTLAEFYRCYRTSPYARKRIAKNLMRYKSLNDFDVQESDENVMAQMLNAYLKVTGKRITFSDDMMEIIDENDQTVSDHKYEDGLFIGTDKEFEEVHVRSTIEKFFREDGCFIGTEDEYKKVIDEETTRMIQARYYKKNKIYDDFLEEYNKKHNK